MRERGKQWPVILLPGIGHIGLSLEPVAIDAIVGMVERMEPRGV